MDFLGWYTTGDTPTERDIAVHRQICDINECPVMLMLNPAGRNGEVCLDDFLSRTYFYYNIKKLYTLIVKNCIFRSEFTNHIVTNSHGR